MTDNEEKNLMKQKFYKNLFQTLSFLAVIMVLELILLLAFFESLSYEDSSGWILLVISLALMILFFLIGFYWIFQTVLIDETGIKIVLIRKKLKEVKWEEIDTMKKANIMRNPAIRIKTFGGTEIHLDQRKSIIKVIETNSKRIIEGY